MKKMWIVFFIVGIGVISCVVAGFSWIKSKPKQELSGRCGENLSWNYDRRGKTLTIKGKGAMDVPHHYWRDHEINKLILEEGLTSISAAAFYGHPELQGELKLPATLEEIGEFAFYGCSGLKGDLIIPDKVKRIEDSTFCNCEGFDGSLRLPDNLQYIGEHAFQHCTFKGELKLPEGLTEIGRAAFADCGKLTGNLLLPDSVKKVGDFAFSGCSGFNGKLKLSSSLECITESCFNSGEAFTGDLMIPEGVKKIEKHAFYGCGFDGSLKLPESLSEIGIYAFADCKKLKGRLDIPNKIVELPDHVFSHCSGIESVSLPDGLRFISNGAFTNCTSLAVPKLPEGLLIVGDNAFNSCTSLKGELVFPDTVLSIGEGSFAYCEKLSGIKLSESLLNIKEDAFLHCTSLSRELLIPDSVYVIGANAFRNTDLKQIQFGTGRGDNCLTSIGSAAFADCAALKQVIFAGAVPDYYEKMTEVKEYDYKYELSPSFPETCRIDFLVGNGKPAEENTGSQSAEKDAISESGKTGAQEITPYMWTDKLREEQFRGTGPYTDLEVIFRSNMELRVNGRRKEDAAFTADPNDEEKKIQVTFPYRGGTVTAMKMTEQGGSSCILEASYTDAEGKQSAISLTNGSEETVYQK